MSAQTSQQLMGCPMTPPLILLRRLAACATALDRAADIELARGRIAVAERLANRALEMREAGR